MSSGATSSASTTVYLQLADGPLGEFLRDPAGFNARVIELIVSLLRRWLPMVLLVIAVGVIAVLAAFVFAELRERRLVRGGRRVRVFPPPEVDAKAALSFWMGVHGLLRPWWKRMLYGQPFVVWEITARPEEVEVSVWTPSSVPGRLVERAVEASWPGARAVREGEAL